MPCGFLPRHHAQNHRMHLSFSKKHNRQRKAEQTVSYTSTKRAEMTEKSLHKSVRLLYLMKGFL